jgi:hypothetical protein
VSAPRELLDAIRALGPELGWPTFLGGCADLVAGTALAGAEALEAAHRRDVVSAAELQRLATGPAALVIALRPLVKEYGRATVITAVAELVREFAAKGAAAHLTEIDYGPQLACPRCRSNDAVRRHYEDVLKRTVTNRPQGGALPSTMED